MPASSYREYPAPPALEPFVECLWFLTQPSSAAEPQDVQRIPPDGCFEVIFHLDRPFGQAVDRRVAAQPKTLVVGVWTQPIALVAPHQYDTVGIRIRPGCWPAFFAETACLLTDTLADAEALWGPPVRRLRDQLGETADERKRLERIAAFLLARLRRKERAIAAPVRRILATRGRASIDAVARDAGISHRQLERVFRAHVGVSPKMLSRIVRFQQVLRQAPASGSGADRHGAAQSWAEVAIDCGYADQSHLIRDFTQFAGETPTALAASAAAVADYFRRR